VNAAVERFLSQHESELISFRRHLHANPELGRTEYETTLALTRRLEEAGLRPSTLSGGTGLTCDVGGVHPGPTIALRADIDALPIQDLKEDVPYRSLRPGICHACGHDVHTSVLLGAGLALAGVASELRGTIRLVFQPAEETSNGAVDVINDGRLEGVDAIFGLHCDPSLAVGKVATRFGAITGSADHVEVLLRGPGGHTARPHLTADLVYVISRVIADLPAGLSRVADPRHAISLVFGMVSAGTAANVIPNTAVARGTLRALDRDAWDLAPKLVERLLEGVISPFGVSHELIYKRGTPPVDNSPEETKIFRRAIGTALGPDAVADANQSLGGEDFAWYLEGTPGSFARLGVRIPGTELDLHVGNFDADERAIGIGVRVMAQVAMDALRHYGA
jgi:amidohydrolase